jgi:hypothetical protein
MCPKCGAIYNVAGKDVGRRIKCKKCGESLIVNEGGLEIDDPNAAPPAAPTPMMPRPAPPASFDDGDMDAPRRRRDRDRDPHFQGHAFNPFDMLSRIGGLSTLLFGFGAFLVIVFLFMPIIGNAAVERVAAAKDKLEQERDAKIKKLVPKGKRLEDLTTDERAKYTEDSEKIRKEYEKQLSEAEDDARYEKISNRRSRWLEMYGMMFGFLFLMAGSIGYMSPEHSLMRRILGTVVLGVQMIVIFLAFSGIGGCGKNATPLP